MNKETLFKGHILSLHILDNKWEVIEHASAVAILAMNNGKILGVKQQRPAIGQITWELPAGLIDAGESPEQAAARELAEETQLKGKLSLITQFHSSPGFTDEKIFLFEATDLSPTQGELDEGEDLSICWLEPRELWESIKAGSLASSSPSVMALQIVLSRS